MMIIFNYMLTQLLFLKYLYNHGVLGFWGHRRGSERVGDTGKLLGAAAMEDRAHGTAVAERPSRCESTQVLKPQPVGQSPAAPHHRNAAHSPQRMPTSPQRMPT